VPGFAVEAKKAKPVQQEAKQKVPQKTKKMRAKKLLVGRNKSLRIVEGILTTTMVLRFIEV
jgi:hypothetical protein